MPTFIFALLFTLVVEAVRTVRCNRRKAMPEPLCTSCVYAHMQYGTHARRAISCAYGGVVQPVKLDVLYCTNYQTRCQPASRAIGFVHQIAPAE